MGHQTKDDEPLKPGAYWPEAILAIAKARGVELRRMKDDADRAIVDAEDTLVKAEQTFTEAARKYGKRSGHKNYERAGSAVDTAKGKCRYSRRERAKLDQQIGVINREQVALDDAVRTFLDGKTPQPRCKSMRLSVAQGGKLHIRFNTDCSEIRGKQSNGLLIIEPTGYMHSLSIR